MAYAAVSDVQALNVARVIGAQGQPTASQVGVYLNMAAGEIDAILVDKGYEVPVNVASYPEAAAYLNAINAKIAWHMMEAASANSPNLDRAHAAASEAKQALVAARAVMDVPKDVLRAEPRGPGVTPTPQLAFGNRPYFTRHQRF
jgi:hypothetical protein